MSGNIITSFTVVPNDSKLTQVQGHLENAANPGPGSAEPLYFITSSGKVYSINLSPEKREKLDNLVKDFGIHLGPSTYLEHGIINGEQLASTDPQLKKIHEAFKQVFSNYKPLSYHSSYDVRSAVQSTSKEIFQPEHKPFSIDKREIESKEDNAFLKYVKRKVIFDKLVEVLDPARKAIDPRVLQFHLNEDSLLYSERAEFEKRQTRAKERLDQEKVPLWHRFKLKVFPHPSVRVFIQDPNLAKEIALAGIDSRNEYLKAKGIGASQKNSLEHLILRLAHAIEVGKPWRPYLDDLSQFFGQGAGQVQKALETIEPALQKVNSKPLNLQSGKKRISYEAVEKVLLSIASPKTALPSSEEVEELFPSYNSLIQEDSVVSEEVEEFVASDVSLIRKDSISSEESI